MTIEIGKTYKFDYPQAFVTLPDYTAHAGQEVTVIRECEDGIDYDREDGELMFMVRATDGWEGVAWDSELLTPGEARKWICGSGAITAVFPRQ